MQRLIIIILVLYSNWANTQSRLSVIPKFCKSGNDISIHDHKIELYNEEELISNEFHPNNNYLVKGIQRGKYTLKYISILKQKHELEIDVNKNIEAITICIDDFSKAIDKTYIEELTNLDDLEITISETGCEYIDHGTLKLLKFNDTLQATITKNEKVQSKILSIEEINILNNLEHKIHVISANEEDGFLRTTHYVMKLNNKEVVRTKYSFEVTNYHLCLSQIFK